MALHSCVAESANGCLIEERNGMRLLERRKGLVFGVANDRSLAWHIADHLITHGATCGFSYYPRANSEHRVRRTLEAGGVWDPWIHPCDVTKDEDLDAFFLAARQQFHTIDFVIHSVAFANRRYLQIGRFSQTPRAAFLEALDASTYSLIAVAQRARRLMPDGGSIISLSYYGGEKVIPGYNVMGVAKAALECTTRYLAAELGEQKIRVNTISAGPCRTLSSMAVGGIDDMFSWVEKKSPLRRNIESEEVGRTAVYLVSDLSSGVTGETVHVDAGYNVVGL